MPSFKTPFVSLSVGAAATGILTVSSTTDVWPGAVGFIAAGGQPTVRVEVLEVLDGTTFTTKLAPKIDDDNFAKGSLAGYPSNSMSWDALLYNGGNITFEPQVVETQPDHSKPATRI